MLLYPKEGLVQGGETGWDAPAAGRRERASGTAIAGPSCGGGDWVLSSGDAERRSDGRVCRRRPVGISNNGGRRPMNQNKLGDNLIRCPRPPGRVAVSTLRFDVPTGGPSGS